MQKIKVKQHFIEICTFLTRRLLITGTIGEIWVFGVKKIKLEFNFQVRAKPLCATLANDIS